MIQLLFITLFVLGLDGSPKRQAFLWWNWIITYTHTNGTISRLNYNCAVLVSKYPNLMHGGKSKGTTCVFCCRPRQSYSNSIHAKACCWPSPFTAVKSQSTSKLLVFNIMAWSKTVILSRQPFDAVPTRSTAQVIFLAHLSRRLIGELIVYPWSGVRPSASVVHNA